VGVPVQSPNHLEPSAGPPAGDDANVRRLREITQRLQETVRRVVQYEPGMRPQQVSRKLGVSKDVASRMVMCCEMSDALEFAYNCPSAATLRKVVEAACDARPGAGAERANNVITEYEEFVQAEFGDQSTMNVLIGAMHPHLGEKAEAVQKQSAFRGMSQLHGLFAEVYVNAAILAHGAESGSRSVVCSEGCLGLRRLRPGPPIVLKSGYINPHTGRRDEIIGERELSTDWREALGLATSPDGSEWVTPTNILLGSAVLTRIDRDILGTRRSVNFGTTTVLPPAPIESAKEAGNAWTGLGLLVPVPSKVLVYDLLVEVGMYGNARPRLLFYDTAMRGPSPLFEPSREFDRLHLHERLEEMDDAAAQRSPDVPILPRLVEFMLRETGLEGRSFRRYRVRQSYPVYGSQVAFAFPRPPG
jgi:hypothetical protein